MNVAAVVTDEPSGVPLNKGAQLVLSLLTDESSGEERKHVRWLHSDLRQLIVVSLVSGGRWSGEAAEFDC